jgi:hypothetical protein
MGRMNTFMAGVVVGLTAAAIGQELAKRPADRTWKGRVAGVPYNFNIPEWSDIASEYWNPENDQILQPHAIGLGWGINFAALSRRLQTMLEAQQQQRIPEPVER